VRTFLVQPASAGFMHCYVNGGKPFDGRVASRVCQIEGVKSVHLVTAGRTSARWCLVLEPSLLVEQGNAEALLALVTGVGQRVGCRGIRLIRPLSRAYTEQGTATDIYDWLKQ
jgi:hypothetical protein